MSHRGRDSQEGVGREVLVERKSPENLPLKISGLNHALEGEEGERGWGEGGEGGGKGSTRRGGGGGSGTQKFVSRKMARPDFSNGKFRFFPTVTLVWGVQGGGGVRPL